MAKKEYCTMFAFEDYHDDLHCTHKYLGELTDNELKALKIILNFYFDKNPFKSFKAKFDKEKMFGEEKDTRVLITSEKVSKFLPELKTTLDLFREDDFDYSPHITTDEDEIHRPFTRYILVCDDKVIEEYE